MLRADENLIKNVRELWSITYTDIDRKIINSIFNYYLIPYETVVEIKDSKLISSLSMTTNSYMINGRVLKASNLFGAITLKGYDPIYLDNIIKECTSFLEYRELISFASCRDERLFLPYGFKTVYKRNRYTLTRNDVSRITNDGCMYDPTSKDMLNLYSSFVKKFNGFKIRDIDDFDKLKEVIKSKAGKIVGYYENGELRSYATFVMVNKDLYIDECIYNDVISLLKLLNIALQQRHTIYLSVSEAENLAPLFENAKCETVGFKMARLNNIDLYNRLFRTKVENIEQIYDNIKKPYDVEIY